MDIYDNLDNFDEVNSVTELLSENKELKIQLDRYSDALEKQNREYNQLFNNHEILLRNYSSMLKTARAEIARKTETIMAINKEKDQMFLRMISDRNNSKRRRNSNMNKADTPESVICNPVNKVLKENRFQSPQLSSDEDDTISKSMNRVIQESRGPHTSRDSREYPQRPNQRDMYSERNSERYREREKTDRNRERDYERERYNRDYHQGRHRMSPERHHRGRATHKDYQDNKYSRNKSRQRVQKSPEIRYSSRSHDRRYPVENTNEIDHQSLKHKIEDVNDITCPKRRKIENVHELRRQVNKCVEEIPSCQSPEDYNLTEEHQNESHIVKEIKSTSTSQLDDPRKKHTKYVQVADQHDKISLTAASGSNVEIKQVSWSPKKQNSNQIPDSDVTIEITKVLPIHSELSNMSVESGEILDNVQHSDSLQTDEECSEQSQLQIPKYPVPTFDVKRDKIPKIKPCHSNKKLSSDVTCPRPSPVELLYKEFESNSVHSNQVDKEFQKMTENSDDCKLVKDSKDRPTKIKHRIGDAVKKSVVEGDLELSDDAEEHALEEVIKSKKHKISSAYKPLDKGHRNESKNENKCEVNELSKGGCSKEDEVKHKTKSDPKEKHIRHKDITHKQDKVEDKTKSKSDKKIKSRHKSKDNSIESENKNSTTIRDKHETKSIHSDKSDLKIKTSTEKELKNGHKTKDHGDKEHTKSNSKNKKTHEFRNMHKDESKHTYKIMQSKKTKTNSERETKVDENLKNKHISKHAAIENASKPKDIPLNQNTEDAIREILEETCIKQKTTENDQTDKIKTKNAGSERNVIDKISDLFGDNSLITPEDLNLGKDAPCDIYSDYIPPGSPSDTQNHDDDLWNVATGAQTSEANTQNIHNLKINAIVTDEIYSLPVQSANNNQSIKDSIKDDGQQSINSSCNIKNLDKDKHKRPEKDHKKHHKSSKHKIKSQEKSNFEELTDRNIEKNVTDNITLNLPVNLVNVTDAQAIIYPENEEIRLEPAIEPDGVKTVIISTGVQPLSTVENSDNIRSLPLLSTTVTNGNDDEIQNNALATSTPVRDNISDIITSAVNSITNLSGALSDDSVSMNIEPIDKGPEDVDKPDIRIRIVRKGRRSLKK